MTRRTVLTAARPAEFTVGADDAPVSRRQQARPRRCARVVGPREDHDGSL